jgi:hypothetical protein
MAKKKRSKKEKSLLPFLALAIGVYLITREKAAPVLIQPDKAPQAPSSAQNNAFSIQRLSRRIQTNYI